ncbi:MAG: hypothetical protein OXG46_01095 [Chloroflexi bacterium]|nr:hypothetical protein [Chloroflexota bacterium]MCY3898102.1 hypothetical protein [Caldilineaceae bacterium]
MSPTLSTVVSHHPYTEYQDWWPVGERFLAMMADAITCQWHALASPADTLDSVQKTVEEYISLVYHRHARPGLAADFASATSLGTVRSGEFDALSFAFFLSAYRSLASHVSAGALSHSRRNFAEKVGAHFFSRLSEHLALELPRSIRNESDLASVYGAVRRIGRFLLDEGYLRSHFAFRFDVHATHAGVKVDQKSDDVLAALGSGGTAYALYEMGHPVILPSAVYLHHIVGEAQHHSSRTIEELFARVGCDAWETDDFDPSLFPSHLVVELWKIRRRAFQGR